MSHPSMLQDDEVCYKKEIEKKESNEEFYVTIKVIWIAIQLVFQVLNNLMNILYLEHV